MANRFTEKLEKVGDKYRIRETFTVNPNDIKTTNISEKVICEGKEYNTHKHYTFRIWDRNFNANGRNYSNVIDETIRNNYITDGLADHPDDDGSVQNICFVEKNPRVIDGWMCVDVYPVGELGRKVEEILDVGGGIEVSSSVLGDIDNDGYVFNMSLERYCDWVRGCSNRQIHYTDHTEQRNDDNSVELVSENGCMTESKDNVTISNIILENKGENNMSDNKLMETSMKMNIQSLIKDADKMENLYEKKESLSSTLTYANELTDKTLAKEIEEKIATIDNELKALSEKGMKTDELADNVKSLTETKEKLEKDIETINAEKSKIESKLNVISQMYEDKQWKAGESELTKNRKLAKEVCNLRIINSKNKKILDENQITISTLKRKLMLAEAKLNTMVDSNELIELKEENRKLRDKAVILEKDLRKAKLSIISEKRVSRFDRVKNSILNKKVENTQVVNESISSNDDDDKMEKMLNGSL